MKEKFLPKVKFGLRKKRFNYFLREGSDLLKVTVWRRLPGRQLKSLIQRFATKEARCSRYCAGRYVFLWRRRRLAAVSEYERRFGEVPGIFKGRKLPPLKSYYMKDGVYVWPTSGTWNNLG
jgi:hypothetical protein